MSQATFPTDHYIYHPLLTPTSFRVLELLPGSREDRISFHLRVEDFENPPDYEAISYCWGKSSAKIPATCDDKLLEITPSLRDGLAQMRLPDKRRLLWADAVCINQEDMTERSHQVQKMLQIYQHATQVLVWLGPCEGNEAELASVAIHEMVDLTCNHRQIAPSAIRNANRLYELVADNMRTYDGLKWEQPRFRKALHWLFSRPWFCRMWVFQEINAGPEGLVLCGDMEISWEVFSLGAKVLECLDTPGVNLWDGFDEEPSILHAVHLRSRHYLKPDDTASLLVLLHLVRVFQTTDPRDKIYGILGLTPMVSFGPVEVDYGKSKSTVYREFADLALSRMQTLDILLFVEHEKEIQEDFPSWVPQWDQAQSKFVAHDMTEFNASSDFPSIVARDVNNSVLVASGIFIDTITEEFQGVHSHPLVELWQSKRSVSYPGGKSAWDAISTTVVWGQDKHGRISDEEQHLKISLPIFGVCFRDVRTITMRMMTCTGWVMVDTGGRSVDWPVERIGVQLYFVLSKDTLALGPMLCGWVILFVSFLEVEFLSCSARRTGCINWLEQPSSTELWMEKPLEIGKLGN
jgi:hypothetical protein